LSKVTSEQVRQWLLGANSDQGIAACSVKGPFTVRDNSRLFYAECTAFPSPAAVKLCLSPHTGQADPDSAHQQYDALLRVSRALGDGCEFSVPRPYLVRADIGLVATEWIAGPGMTDLLLSWRCGTTQAQDLMARAGRWLRVFHQAHALAPGRLDVEHKLPFVAEMESTAAASEPLFRRALSSLRQSAEPAAMVTLNRSWIHGDFKSDNLIVAGPRTVGIDIQLRRENAVVYDLAPFLNHLELSLCHPAGWRLARSQALLRKTFLSAYHPVPEDAVGLPLAWVQLYLLLQGWQAALAGSWLRSTFANLCYRRVARRLVSRIARYQATGLPSCAA